MVYKITPKEMQEFSQPTRPFFPKLILNTLKNISYGIFSGKFPCQIYAADLLPNEGKCQIKKDVSRTVSKISALEFIPLKEDVYGSAMCKMAVSLNANLGIVDGKFILEHQEELPKKLRHKCIVLTGTLVSNWGPLSIAYLFWNKEEEKWAYDWLWLDREISFPRVLPRVKQ